MFFPPNSTFPSSGFRSPDMIPRSVVLPEPDLPVITVMDRSFTSKLTSLSIFRSPNFMETFSILIMA